MEHAFSEHVLTERVATRGSVILALIGGFAAAVVGTIIWISFALITGWPAGYLALVIAFMVGICIQASGQGSHFIYGIFGILFTLGSCLMGEIGLTMQRSTTSAWDLYTALTHTDILSMSYAIITQVSPTMTVVYVLAAVEAYMLSRRR